MAAQFGRATASILTRPTARIGFLSQQPGTARSGRLLARALTQTNTATTSRRRSVCRDPDALSTEALAAFEITQRGYAESLRAAAEASQRIEVLGGLADAYLAIAGQTTLEQRLAEVCLQARTFFDAADVVLRFDRRDAHADHPAADTMSAQLEGSGGRLIVYASPAQRWTDRDRVALAHLALLISSPVNDARRLGYLARFERVGAALAREADEAALIEHFLAEILLVDVVSGATLRLDGAQRDVGMQSTGTRIVDRQRILDGVTIDGEARFIGDANGVAGASDDPLVESGDAAWAALPIAGGDGCRGALGMWYRDPQPFDAIQRDYLRRLVGRLESVLIRGAAFERERLARRDAEKSSAQLAALQELAISLSTATTREQVATALLRRAIRWSGATGALVATVDGEHKPLRATGWMSRRRRTLDPARHDLLDALLTDLGRLGPAASAESLAPDIRRRLNEYGAESLAVVPMTAGGEFVGVLMLSWAEPFAADVLDDFLRAQVALVGPALGRAGRYDIEHHIADTLQRSFLRTPPITTPNVEWDAFYRAGSHGLAGGDWYDVYSLTDDRVAFVVGDVVGRGAEAAAAMGQLRSAARATAPLVEGPAQLLTMLDAFTKGTNEGQMSSVACLVLHTQSGLLEHAVAGHPPPVLVHPDGSTELLATGRGKLLGLEGSRHPDQRRLERGTRIVLYTDGLIERRGEPIDVGIERLRSVLTRVGTGGELDQLCGQLAEQLTASDDRDDVVILAVEFDAS